MKNDAWHDSWSQVDQTGDPGFFVRFLDTTRLAAIRAAHINPAKHFAYLNIKAGDAILEVGCGTGGLLTPLSDLVGPKGRVVGIDSSRAMIAEAQRRSEKAGARVEFAVGDAHRLELGDSQFDHCLAVSVFQHLIDPEAALREIVRVARPGGRITITETDWDTQIVDSDDIAVTRRVLHFFSESIRNGRIARRLPAMMRECGLEDAAVTGMTSTADSPDDPEAQWLSEAAHRAAEAGAITAKEAQRWIAELVDRGNARRFFGAFTTFRITAVKPA